MNRLCCVHCRLIRLFWSIRVFLLGEWEALRVDRKLDRWPTMTLVMLSKTARSISRILLMTIFSAHWCHSGSTKSLNMSRWWMIHWGFHVSNSATELSLCELWLFYINLWWFFIHNKIVLTRWHRKSSLRIALIFL